MADIERARALLRECVSRAKALAEVTDETRVRTNVGCCHQLWFSESGFEMGNLIIPMPKWTNSYF